MLTFSLGIYVLTQLINLRYTGGLQCYNCSNIVDADDCLTVTECLAGQSCYQDKRVSDRTITLGCMDNMQCGILANGAGSLVGRSLGSRQVQDCHECCSSDTCNKNLCNYLKRAVCYDHYMLNCAFLNTSYNVCKDFHGCPNFCGLCPFEQRNRTESSVTTNTCYYGGKYYHEGEQWKDGCKYKCTCHDGKTGFYQCQTLCLQWTLPQSCHLDPPPAGKCCQVPICPSNVQLQYPPGFVQE